MKNKEIEYIIEDGNRNTTMTEYHQSVFTTTPIEEKIIKAAQQGDKKAFETLFMGTYRYVFFSIKKHLKNDQDIYDTIQETYIKVYKGISQLQSVASFYPWLHRICENCAKDLLTHNGNKEVLSDNDDIEQIPIPDKSEESDVFVDVSEVLKELPKEQAELLILVYYDKMRVAEIARIKSLPVTTVHNRLKAAKKKLKELLKIRGIDKPIYSGEFVSMVSASIRDAIGTQLLSLAVAEEILHNATSVKHKKGAAVVSASARKTRNNAVRKIAAILLLFCVSTTIITFLILNVITNKGYKNNPIKNSSVLTGSDKPSSPDDTSSANTPSIPDANSNLEDSSQKPDSTEETPDSDPSQSDLNISTMQGEVELVGSFTDTEIFGTHVDNDELDIAVTDNKVYAVVKGNLLSLSSGKSDFQLLIENFKELYGDNGKLLNVFNEKVYWVNKNSKGIYVLNRCNIDGSGHYSVDFKGSWYYGGNTTFTHLNKMIVTKDGIYLCLGRTEYGNEYTTLYRLDYDFNNLNHLDGVADFTIIKDKIYCIGAAKNCGHPWQIDRVTFGNATDITADAINYDSIYSVGEYIVLDSHSTYADSKDSPSTNMIVMDTATRKIVRAIYGKANDVIDVKDVSDVDGGTILIHYNDKALIMNVKTGKIEVVSNYTGAVSGKRKYFIKSDSLYVSNIDGSSQKKIY